jgi:hypothetical protein
MIAVAGSTGVTGSTSTRPPPNRRRLLPLLPLPVRADEPVRVDSAAVRTDGAVAAAVRTDGAVAAADRTDGAVAVRCPPVGFAAVSGAMPHTLQ